MNNAMAAGFRSGFRVILRWSGSKAALVLPPGVAGEVLFDTVPAPIPRAPRGIAGLVAVQGRPLVVHDLFDPWSTTTDPRVSQVVIIRAAADMIAIRTDAAPGFATVTGEHGTEAGLQVPDMLAGSCGARVELDGEHGQGLLWDPMQWARRRAATSPSTPSENEPPSGESA